MLYNIKKNNKYFEFCFYLHLQSDHRLVPRFHRPVEPQDQWRREYFEEVREYPWPVANAVELHRLHEYGIQ